MFESGSKSEIDKMKATPGQKKAKSEIGSGMKVKPLEK